MCLSLKLVMVSHWWYNLSRCRHVSTPVCVNAPAIAAGVNTVVADHTVIGGDAQLIAAFLVWEI